VYRKRKSPSCSSGSSSSTSSKSSGLGSPSKLRFRIKRRPFTIFGPRVFYSNMKWMNVSHFNLIIACQKGLNVKNRLIMNALFEHKKILLHTSPVRKKIKLDKDLFLHSKYHCFEHCTCTVKCRYVYTAYTVSLCRTEDDYKGRLVNRRFCLQPVDKYNFLWLVRKRLLSILQRFD
jgi:hypothetical protein